MKIVKLVGAAMMAALSLSLEAQQPAQQAPPLPARGIDHVGITVPDLDAASHFLVQAFGAILLYDNITRSQPPMEGTAAERELDLAHGTKLITMRMMRLANGPGIELFEMKGPTQQHPTRPSGFWLQHVAVYVDDIDASLRRFVAAGGTILSGPNVMLGLEKGAGNKWSYARAPWGTVFELITYPGAEGYEKLISSRRWTPQP
jgi:catechol 2,3-dioxygenase-like lactoylglutathione lyase family enzyme